MSYRLELAKTARAGCTNTECKKNGEKIAKDTLRLGVLVTIQEHQTWKWRHWGCVTPKMISNMKETTEDDFDLLDGYDELPEDLQVTVRRAFEQGHVDDADWKGDLEQNRPGAKSFRSPAAKKQKKAAEKEAKLDNGSGSQSPTKPAPKKRGRAKKEEGHNDAEIEEPPTKKSKAAAKKEKKPKAKDEPEADDTEDVPSMKSTAAAKKVSKKASNDVDESDKAPPPKKSRAKKKTSKEVEENHEHAAEDAESNQDVEIASTKRSRAPRKAAAAQVQAEVDVASDDEEGMEGVGETKKRRKKAAGKQAVTNETKASNGAARKGTRGKKAQ